MHIIGPRASIARVGGVPLGRGAQRRHRRCFRRSLGRKREQEEPRSGDFHCALTTQESFGLSCASKGREGAHFPQARRLHMTPEFDRRHFLGAAAGVALAAGPARTEELSPPAKGMPFVHAIKPLPFDPKGRSKASQRTFPPPPPLAENNYGGAVKRLNAISEQLAGLDFEKAPDFQVNGAEARGVDRDEFEILHEIYFAGLGEANRPGAQLVEAIERDVGSFDRWRRNFPPWARRSGEDRAGGPRLRQAGQAARQLMWRTITHKASPAGSAARPRHVRARLSDGFRRRPAIM